MKNDQDSLSNPAMAIKNVPDTDLQQNEFL